MKVIMKVKKIAEEQKIWNKKKEAVKFEEEAKKLVSQRFYKQIHIFGKKVSERICQNCKKWTYFHSISYFIFYYFLFQNLELEFNVTSQVTVTSSYHYIT